MTETITRFIDSKKSPSLAVLKDILNRGEAFPDREGLTDTEYWTKYMLEHSVSITWVDVYRQMTEEEGMASNVAISFLMMLGIGANKYGDD